jgi:hypothetical protein
VRGIYAIRHAKTGGAYIGKSNSVEARWRQHRHDLDCGKHINAGLQADWARDGADAFTFEVLEEYVVLHTFDTTVGRRIDDHITELLEQEPQE